MESFLHELGAGPWAYLAVFFGIVITGLGFPMPEELPVVLGGGLAGKGFVYWWIMLPACIAGVIVGDSFLYMIGRLWGPRLLQRKWVKTKLLPPERFQKIEQNFQQYGVRILLFARLTPGIRAPIFFTAGLTRLSVGQFLLADGIYAVPGVSLLFFLGYWFTEAMVHLVADVEKVKNYLIVGLVAAVVIYILYRMLRRPVVTGNPKEMPRMVEQVTQGIEHGIERVSHGLEAMKTVIIHPHKTIHLDPPPKHEPPSVDGQPPPETPRPATEPRGPAPSP